jgi:hypothetical protein
MATVETCTSGTQTIFIDPSSKLVSVVATAQSSGTQNLSITDSTGKEVFSAKGASSSGGTYTVIGQGTFSPSGDGNYSVKLTSGSGILYGNGDVVNNGKVFNAMHTFSCNDGGCTAGDKDFNDLVVQIMSFLNKG